MKFNYRFENTSTGISNLFADFFKSVYGTSNDKNYVYNYNVKIDLDFSPISELEIKIKLIIQI